MAVSVTTEGSQTTTINTEHELATATAANVYQLQIQVQNMSDPTATSIATGDILEIREYGRVRATSTDELIGLYTLNGAQADEHWRGTPVVSPHYYRCTLKQTSATVGRAFAWALYQIQ